MKAQQVAELITILFSIGGLMFAAYKGFGKYMDTLKEIAKQKEGRSDAILNIEGRLNRIEEELEDMKKNEEYLNLLERLAERYGKQ